uniref:DUF6625 family protein n=1 Tax=Flavobacterium sp. TaxID=239 RepID=UPI0025C6B873
MNNKIAFVIPYFGKLPTYFLLFVNSVKEKPFDILFFTDIKKPDNLPSNIIWIPFEKQELQNLFSRKLEFAINLPNPYKLCDYKPLYGLCFEEYLINYTFWGSLDIDTVVGNFEKFINDKTLDNIDIYSGIKEYVSGAFFLIRNNRECNNLFKQSKDWQKVLLEPIYSGFDECGGHYFEQLKSGESIFDLNIPIESFTEVVFKEYRKGLRICFENTVLEPKGSAYVVIKKDSVQYLN